MTMIGEINGKFKRVNTFTEISTLRPNALRFELCACSHPPAAFPHVEISNIKRQGNALSFKATPNAMGDFVKI